MSKSITRSLNLRVFMLGEAIRMALTRSLWERVLAVLGPLGSWSFSPVGGNCLHSEGELAYVLSVKRKEDCQDPQRALVANLKEDYLLDPCWFSGNPLWGVPLFLRQICARTNGPQNGETPLRGSTRQNSGGLRWSHPPLPQGWGKMSPVERGEWTQNERTKNEKAIFLGINNLCQSRIPEVAYHPEIIYANLEFRKLHIIRTHLHLIIIH